jgi:UDP:flavonoid glycosyltransferase YjiC (YdhE family)
MLQVPIPQEKRIAFVTVPLSGHKRAAIALATEMSQRGFQVDYLIDAKGVTSDMLELERALTTLKLHPLTQGKELVEDVDWSYIASSTGRFGGSKIALFEEIGRVGSEISGSTTRVRAGVDILRSLRPDVVVVDHSQMLLREWAEVEGIPTVIMHTPYYLTGPPTGCAQMCPETTQRLVEIMTKSNPMEKIMKGRAALGLPAKDDDRIPEGAANAVGASGLAPHTLVFCEPELLHEPNVPARVHVVGPCFTADPGDPDEHLVPWLQDAVAQGDKVLYVAFGTLANGFLTATTMAYLLDVFRCLGKGWRVLWSLPEAQLKILRDDVKGFDDETSRCLRLETFVRQRAVLSHPAVKLFLTHGGQSSANEGIAAGLPLVCMPLFCDQYEVAEAVQCHGLGLVFHKDELAAGNAARISEVIFRAAEENCFRSTAQRYAHLMRLRRGCARACEVLESIVWAGVDYQELWRGQCLALVEDRSPGVAAGGGA